MQQDNKTNDFLSRLATEQGARTGLFEMVSVLGESASPAERVSYAIGLCTAAAQICGENSKSPDSAEAMWRAISQSTGLIAVARNAQLRDVLSP